MLKKISWLVFAFLAVSIGLYPSLYFFLDRKFSLLATKTDEVLTDPAWNVGFYIHIIFAGLAMLAGWTQFSPRIRKFHLDIHRTLGKIYVVSVMLAAPAGFYIAFNATGGIVSGFGFSTLAVLWFSTTLVAYLAIRRLDTRRHEMAMIFSYSLCFAAVTLRLWLPVLIYLIDDYHTAYRTVAWLCWVPNLIFALIYTRRLNMKIFSA
jgi:uncharacterized membrane protein